MTNAYNFIKLCNFFSNDKIQLQISLFTQLREVGFAWSITKMK